VRIIVSGASAELDVKNSRFLAEAFPVQAQDEARALLKAQKAKYPDANHVVHAFVIGPTGGILGCSDDGEPSGTAGRPALDVLKGSDLTNILVTVTRWFGGTLLGTGGLVKAYSEATKAVLAAVASRPLVAMRSFTLDVPYELYELAKREMAARAVEVTREEFGTDVSIAGKIEASAAESFCLRITDLSSGRLHAALSEESRTAQTT
jgi:uncharacterized YigZ family protein